MSDSLPTVWPAEPHTRAKHAILEGYLKAWMAIMSHQAAKSRQPSQTIRFIDAFAGPGIYEGGEDGSPILAIKTALKHEHSFPFPIHCLFIEKNRARFDCLCAKLKEFEEEINHSPNIVLDKPQCGDANRILGGILDNCNVESKPFGPALVFLDQFGYSDAPMTLISRVLSHPRCEVFSYLDYTGINRFCSDSTKDSARDDAFGSRDWKDALSLEAEEREQFLLRLYRDSLKKHGQARYVWDFAMEDQSGRLLYWLFFSTNNLRGLEEMKSAMHRVDGTGSFRFSDDFDPTQLQLFRPPDDDWLAEHLASKLAGRTMSIEEVKEFVLTETPCCKYALAMKKIRAQKKLTIIGCKPGKRISFTKDLSVRVRFEDRGLF